MRLFSLYFLVFCAVCAVMISPAKAEPKPCIYLGWWPAHWNHQDYQPHYENAKDPHNTQWNDKAWTPDDWAAQRVDRLSIIDDFYRADILRKQYMDDDIPVLEVGPNFYHLSGFDKRRVTQMVDNVFEATDKEPHMFYVKDPKTDKVIGLYTKNGGLHLQ